MAGMVPARNSLVEQLVGFEGVACSFRILKHFLSRLRGVGLRRPATNGSFAGLRLIFPRMRGQLDYAAKAVSRARNSYSMGLRYPRCEWRRSGL